MGQADKTKSVEAAAETASPTVPANAQFSKKFHFWLDEPTDWSRPVRWLRLTGWCVAKNGQPLTAIRASVRGQTFEGRFDRERREVGAYIGMPDAPRWCGFTIDAEVPFGKGRLQVHVAGPTGPWLKVFATDVRGPLFVSAAERERQREIELADAARHYDFWFDRPAQWGESPSLLHIGGWCVDRRGGWTHGIRARIGSQTFEGNFGIVRKDIAELFPEKPAALRSGFAVAVAVPKGESKILLELKGVDGIWHPFVQRAVAGTNAKGGDPLTPEEAIHYRPDARPARFAFWCDQPRDWSKPAQKLDITGWCVTIYGEPITELRARIGPNEFAVQYGLERPEIALAFELAPGTLQSGFSCRVEVPARRSDFVLEGRAPNGAWERIFTRNLAGRARGRKHATGSGQIDDYTKWIRLYDTPTRADREAIQRHIARLTQRPLFSVLLYVHNPHLPRLRLAIESLHQQLYPDWELCIVDDASSTEDVWDLLRESAQRDSRIKILRRGEYGRICAALNDALGLATGEFIALLNQDDELAPAALYFAALELNRDSKLQVIYGDEDKKDERGVRCQPHFKPDWNPDLFTADNYLSRAVIYRLALIRRAGGFRPGLEDAHDYDIALRCSEQTDAAQVGHIPRILYHVRIAPPSPAAVSGLRQAAIDAALRAVAEYLDRTAAAARVEPYRAIYRRVRYALPPEKPLVSLILPAGDRIDLLRQCLNTILSRTDYPNFEIIMVCNQSQSPEALEYCESLRGTERLSILPVDGHLNLSGLKNAGVGQARGIFVGLLHDDLEVINSDWLSEMVSLATRPQTGAVGARIWNSDDSLQHAGMILGAGGVASPVHGGTRGDNGYFHRSDLTRNFSAVTGACLLIRREIYLRVGGLDDANLAADFSDIDFCLRLREAGFGTVWTPHAEFYRHESRSRGSGDNRVKPRRETTDEQFMRKKWGGALANDPFYNPNLSLGDELFTLAWPPRVTQPWRIA